MLEVLISTVMEKHFCTPDNILSIQPSSSDFNLFHSACRVTKIEKNKNMDLRVQVCLLAVVLYYVRSEKKYC